MLLRFIIFALTILTLIVHSCVSKTQDKAINTGEWRFTFQAGEYLIPVNATLSQKSAGLYEFSFINGEEKIKCEQAVLSNDKLQFRIPYFNGSIELYIDSPELLTGYYHNHDRESYRIPLVGVYNETFRFTNTSSSTTIPLRYKSTFKDNNGGYYEAVLLLNNKNGSLTGTFLTETGDYRFLEGNIMNNSIYLSTFDGSHLYYFQASINGDSLTNGVFLSGKHYQTSWTAYADSEFNLRNPEDITYVVDSTQVFDFRLPNLNGDTVSWSDLNLDNKIVIVELMGSWCPNCLDATRSLEKIKSQYPEIEILPITFEYSSELTIARPSIQRVLHSGYSNHKIIFGGKASKSNASQLFPIFNGISAFPTLVVIDKNRKIRMIYSGFYGPGTGELHEGFYSKITEVLDEISKTD